MLATDLATAVPDPVRALVDAAVPASPAPVRTSPASGDHAVTAEIAYRTLDVRSDDDWAAARRWVEDEWRGLDLLLNNAGVAAGGRIELVPMDEWQWIIDINLLGVVRGCHTFAPMLKAQGSGHIVNTASAAGLVHPPRMSSYNAVKAGVVALSETLSHELGAYGVTVSVVCPTFFRTNLADSLPGSDPDAQRSARQLIDQARLGPDEMAIAVLKGIDAVRHLILPDREARLAYLTKRFARPLYNRQMSKLARHMRDTAER